MSLSSQLRALPLFSELSEQQTASLAAACAVRAATVGDLFFLEGDPAAGLFFMLSGKVKVFRSTPDGREAVLHVFGAGEPFGEVAVFEGGRFPAGAVCVEAGKALFVPRRALLEGIAADPALAMRMLAALSRRLRAFAAKVENLALKETPQRVAAYLLLVLEERGAEGSGPATVELDVSKTLLAGLLGTARETLSRCLGRMAEQGLISMDGRTVIVHDRAALSALAAGRAAL